MEEIVYQKLLPSANFIYLHVIIFNPKPLPERVYVFTKRCKNVA